jgi:hypothetical protein
VSQPPIVPLRTWPPPTAGPAGADKAVRDQFRAYRETLEDDRQAAGAFPDVDAAKGGRRRQHGTHRPAPGATRGTRCSCRSRRRQPRFSSRTSERAGTGSTASEVQGQRMMRAASDITWLTKGWTCAATLLAPTARYEGLGSSRR